MRPEVRNQWIAWSAAFEGRVSWMYLDIKGLVTTGVGNLIDPVEAAVKLPWKRKADGQPATEAQIRAEWQHVKSAVALAHDGYRAAGLITTLRLDEPGIDALVLAKLDDNDRILAGKFPEWDSLPWQAQMAIHSMAWAMGPYFPRTWPRFTAAINVRNWPSAAAECWIPDAGNPGLTPRNKANRALLIEAANAAPALPPGRGSPVPPPAVAGPAPERERAAPREGITQNGNAANGLSQDSRSKEIGWLEALIARLLALFGKRAG